MSRGRREMASGGQVKAMGVAGWHLGELGRAPPALGAKRQTYGMASASIAVRIEH